MKVYENGVLRILSQEEIDAWDKIGQQMPTPLQTPEEQSLIFVRAMAATATNIPDKVARSIPDLLAIWEELLGAGEPIQPGVCLTYNGQVYRMVQPSAVTPQAHQPPGGEGMLAVYRPIDREHTGTADDPIPWVSGMDCEKDKYYLHDGVIYRAKQKMSPCTWIPGSPGTDTVWEIAV